MTDLLGIVHCKRGESVPHWQHQNTMTILEKPCPIIDIWEDHDFDIGSARQSTTETLLAAFPEMTHILHVDDDLATNNRYALLGMFRFLEQYNASIVSGLYYNKARSHYPCPTCGHRGHEPIIFNILKNNDKLAFTFPYRFKKPKPNHIYEVTCIPAGFLLVKREVFEKLEKPWFVYRDPELRKQFGASEKGPGEDVYFSYKATQAGFKLYIDTRAEFIHYVPGWAGRQELIDEMLGTDKPVAAVRAEYFRTLDEKCRLKKTESAGTAE